MATAFHEKKIKSADRVLEIFEMFSGRRQSLTVMEVARALDVPQSSTSELMGNLVRRSYLTRNSGARTYRPTARIALLGAWVHPSLFREGRLLPMMDRLAAQSGLGVSLCSMVGVSLTHLHSVGEQMPAALYSGAEPHLLHSPFGQVLLSTCYAEDVRKIIHRLNAESDFDLHVRYKDLAFILDQISRQGYRLAEAAQGWSALSVLLPRTMNEEQLAVGFVGRTAELNARRDELVCSLRQAIAQQIGPRLASDSKEERFAQA